MNDTTTARQREARVSAGYAVAKPDNAFTALWLTHALEAAKAHRRPTTRANMAAVAPWVAVNTDPHGNVSERKSVIGRAIGISESNARGALSALRGAGFLTATPRTNEAGIAMPTVYGLSLPAVKSL